MPDCRAQEHFLADAIRAQEESEEAGRWGHGRPSQSTGGARAANRSAGRGLARSRPLAGGAQVVSWIGRNDAEAGRPADLSRRVRRRRRGMGRCVRRGPVGVRRCRRCRCCRRTLTWIIRSCMQTPVGHRRCRLFALHIVLKAKVAAALRTSTAALHLLASAASRASGRAVRRRPPRAQWRPPQCDPPTRCA